MTPRILMLVIGALLLSPSTAAAQARAAPATSPPVARSAADYLPNADQVAALLAAAGLGDVQVEPADPVSVEAMQGAFHFTATSPRTGEVDLVLLAAILPTSNLATAFLNRVDETVYSVDNYAEEYLPASGPLGLDYGGWLRLVYDDSDGDLWSSYVYELRQGRVVVTLEAAGAPTSLERRSVADPSLLTAVAGLDAERDRIETVVRDEIVARLRAYPPDTRHAPADAGWQVSAPRSAVATGSWSIELGLRNRWGTSGLEASRLAGDVHTVWCVVIDPGGNLAFGSGVLIGDEWSELWYPDHFLDGATWQPGDYSVIWYAGVDEVARDSFIMR